jgi:gliding motility-associated-like protein
MNFFQKICLVLISINLLGSKYPEIQSNTCNCQPEKVKIDFNNCSLSEFDIIREAGAGGGGSASIINSGFSGCGVSVTRPVILISKNANFSFGTYTIKARAVTRIANQYLTIFGNVDLSAALAVGVQPKNTDDEGWDVYVNGKQLGGGRRPVPVVFPNWYEIKVRVTPDSISFWLDNNLMFETGNNRVNKFPKCGKIILPAFSTSEYDELTYEPFYDTAMFKITEISQTICQNSTFEGYSNSGIYTDFFSSDSICDSIRILNLTVGNEYINNLQYSICQGESFLGYNQSGIFTDTFQIAQGCDSIRILNLNVNPTFQNNLNQNICQGESFLGYNQSGIFRDTFQSALGCDSIQILNLTVNPTFQNNLNQNICQGESFLGYNQSGIFRDTFQTLQGCDSIRILNLTVNPTFQNNLNQNICQGESFLGYNQSGIFTDTFQTAQGCDSIRVLNLTVNPTFQNNLNQNICQGESFLGYNQSGIFRDTFQTLQGCDSIRILVLKVDSNQIKPNFLGEDLTICDRDDYVLTSPVDGTIWSNGIISKSIRLRNDALVVAKIIDANGCEISDSIQIKFAKKFYLPNSFSPNGDGINDCYFPVLGDQFQPSDFEIKIYDRWGSIVFFSKDFKNCWDGKIKGENSNSGTFLSEIKYLDENCGQVNVVQNLFLVR